MDFKLRVKQFFCKHDFKPWANIYDPLIESFANTRTVFLCKKCHKRKYSEDYIDAVFNYNIILSWLDSYCKNQDQKVLEQLESALIQDKEKYKEFYDIEN